jgi:hypothetical protein
MGEVGNPGLMINLRRRTKYTNSEYQFDQLKGSHAQKVALKTPESWFKVLRNRRPLQLFLNLLRQVAVNTLHVDQLFQ